MTTTVSSEWEIGLKYGYSPDACTSRARVKFLHLSKSVMFCRVSVPKGPRPGGRWGRDYLLRVELASTEKLARSHVRRS